MAQKGQVFPLAGQGADGTQWAYRYRVGGRLRQVLARVVSWGLLDVNPAKLGVEPAAVLHGEAAIRFVG
jgi:hypothetical protein